MGRVVPNNMHWKTELRCQKWIEHGASVFLMLSVTLNQKWLYYWAAIAHSARSLWIGLLNVSGIYIFLLSQKIKLFEFSKKIIQERISVLNYWCLIVQVQHEKRQEEKSYLRDNYHSTGIKSDICALCHTAARPIWTGPCDFSSHPLLGCAVTECSHHLSSCPISILATIFSVELI